MPLLALKTGCTGSLSTDTERPPHCIADLVQSTKRWKTRTFWVERVANRRRGIESGAAMSVHQVPKKNRAVRVKISGGGLGTIVKGR